VRLGGGATLSYDRLVVTVGSTIRAGAIERYDEAAMRVMPHAWKACGQTLTLRRQLASRAFCYKLAPRQLSLQDRRQFATLGPIQLQRRSFSQAR
jgi:NADH dehydrogenase FAD-containing subunit